MVGFYPMVGDLLHMGHVIAIEEAKQNCDYLIIGLNCKPTGKNPTQSIFERYKQLQAIKYVDEIIPYEGKEDLELLALSLNYQIRFLGEEYRDKEWDGKSNEILMNKQFYFLSRKHGLSSTELKKRCLSREKSSK